MHITLQNQEDSTYVYEPGNSVNWVLFITITLSLVDFVHVGLNVGLEQQDVQTIFNETTMEAQGSLPETEILTLKPTSKVVSKSGVVIYAPEKLTMPLEVTIENLSLENTPKRSIIALDKRFGENTWELVAMYRLTADLATVDLDRFTNFSIDVPEELLGTDVYTMEFTPKETLPPPHCSTLPCESEDEWFVHFDDFLLGIGFEEGNYNLMAVVKFLGSTNSKSIQNQKERVQCL